MNMAVFEPNDHPVKAGETPQAYAFRLQSDGHREIVLRKCLRAAFDLDIKDIIEICDECPKARRREIDALRENFPTLSQNRFTWRIGQSMSLSKAQAIEWAAIIFEAEGEE
jgi:hypothetical protein